MSGNVGRGHEARLRRRRPRRAQPAGRRPPRRHLASHASSPAPRTSSSCVLQEVERLQDELREARETGARNGGGEGSGTPRAATAPVEVRPMNPVRDLARAARGGVEFTNIILTTPDAHGSPARRGTSSGRTARPRCTATARRERTHAVPGAARLRADQPARTSSTCGRATRSSSTCSTRASTSSCSTGACPATRTPTWASTTTSATSCRGAIRETLRASGQEEVTLARLVHRRHAVRDVRRARARGPGAQPRPADHADRHDRLAVRGLGRAATASTSTRSPTRCRPSPARASTWPTS